MSNQTILLAWPSIKHSPGRGSQKCHSTITEQLSYVNLKVLQISVSVNSWAQKSRGTPKLLGSKSSFIWWLLFRSLSIQSSLKFLGPHFKQYAYLNMNHQCFTFFQYQSLHCKIPDCCKSLAWTPGYHRVYCFQLLYLIIIESLWSEHFGKKTRTIKQPRCSRVLEEENGGEIEDVYIILAWISWWQCFSMPEIFFLRDPPLKTHLHDWCKP